MKNILRNEMLRKTEILKDLKYELLPTKKQTKNVNGNGKLLVQCSQVTSSL